VHPYRTFSGYFPTPYVPDFPARETVTVNIEIRPERAATYAKEPEAAPAPPPGPIVTIRPAAPKTFYVIPRCYAGDRPPSADQLPAGCDLRKLRVIEAGAP
jgi:hypothetical protein